MAVTIEQQLTALDAQRDRLAQVLTNKGVSAAASETLNSLVNKVEKIKVYSLFFHGKADRVPYYGSSDSWGSHEFLFVDENGRTCDKSGNWSDGSHTDVNFNEENTAISKFEAKIVAAFEIK